MSCPLRVQKDSFGIWCLNFKYQLPLEKNGVTGGSFTGNRTSKKVHVLNYILIMYHMYLKKRE